MNASAEITYWRTVGPPAHNSTWDLYYYHYHGDFSPCEPIQVALEDDTQDLYGAAAFTHIMTTNDYTNLTEWVDPGESDYREPVGYMPPEGATITTVSVYVRFTVYRPQMQLAFSINGGSSYTSSSVISETTDPLLGVYVWNVTSLATWTPTLLNSTDVFVKGTFWPTVYTHYYLDYLGFVVDWHADIPGGGDLGGEEEEEYEPNPLPGVDSGFLLEPGGIMFLIGLTGFIGMIAIPPAAVWMFRRDGGSKLHAGISALVAFMLCFTMFLAALD